ncbi:TRAP transporter small permease subunit [Variovorax dokdonensis]|uniref:TRAP transporter small permease protein n=1 Tax=Variovorax dokdonensis TaxID=344883 RepID=A0ABT7NG47_9BURK|nr:TRAP transporter small permease subunit [Variovorax dokdonensis]MDM0046805.1 TRAP transporter small permease subunit [Variovorax dokdonensis]
MRQLCDAIDRLNDWVGSLAALLILPSLLITMIEVVARYAFNSPTVWVNESVQILFGFYFLLGGGYTLLHGGHVRVDLLLLGLKPRARRRADVIGLVVTIFYFAVLLWFTGDQAIDAIASRERAESPWAPYIFPVLTAAPVAAALMLLQAVALIVRAYVDPTHAIKPDNDVVG